jgi:hypothetical protein
MSTNSRKIGQVLRQFSNSSGKVDNRNLFFTAEVNKVDGETCDVEIAETIYSGVHLAAVSDGNKSNLIIKPKVGSVVLICDKTGGDMAWMNVVAFSEIESVTMKVDEIVINEGKNDGMIIIQKLTDKINDLVGWCRDHTHLLSTGSVSVEGAMGVSANTAPINVPKPLSPPKQLSKSDYENDKIKH